ncbi:hypothetical protein L1049_020528 [Liquidambar formosana]|uniref:Transcription repressor n=1 Tax=Liquidambar formosana TaxID=63359 RepID=A0AAP0X3Z3_LIQFO
MDVAEELNQKPKKKILRKRNAGISFSARLPDDVGGFFAATTICAVKYSMDPVAEMRESILEMIRDVGVRDWNEMEELIYCYIALNSSDVHEFVSDAFLSLCSFNLNG